MNKKVRVSESSAEQKEGILSVRSAGVTVCHGQEISLPSGGD